MLRLTSIGIGRLGGGGGGGTHERAGKVVRHYTYSHLVPSNLISKEKKGWTYISTDYFMKYKKNLLALEVQMLLLFGIWQLQRCVKFDVLKFQMSD